MNSFLRLGPLVAVLLLLAATFSSAVALDKPPKDKEEAKKPNYYPMQLGNQWNFRLEVGGNSANAIYKIAKIEKIDDVPLARLEATINDKIISTEHLRQTDKGIFRHRNNGQDITPPICLLQYPVKSGSKWDGDITVGTEKGKYSCEATQETIEVAAGKFKTMRVAIRFESQGKAVNTTYWFVNDVGMVKQTFDAGNLNIGMELEKFAMATPKKKQ